MMSLPFYIPLLMIAATLLTVYFLARAMGKEEKTVWLLCFSWLGIQAMIALAGFYEETKVMPPRFLLALLPPLAGIALLLLTNGGCKLSDSGNAAMLVLLHTVRIPVELTLFLLSEHKAIPELMTFAGRNPDILSGITAIFIWYFGYRKPVLPRWTLLGWHMVCLALLIHIVADAIFSAPFPFQRFAFDQPNIAVLYFPFVWLPSFIVPAVLLSHLICIRQLLSGKKETADSISTVSGSVQQ